MTTPRHFGTYDVFLFHGGALVGSYRHDTGMIEPAIGQEIRIDLATTGKQKIFIVNKLIVDHVGRQVHLHGVVKSW